MDQSYDAIILGTGLKECLVAGLLSAVDGMKILHVDRNDYYGGESASLNLNQLFEKFAPEKASDKSTLTARYGPGGLPQPKVLPLAERRAEARLQARALQSWVPRRKGV